MRSKRVPWLMCAALLVFLPTTVSGQSESTGVHPTQIPGRRELKGTLTETAATKGFSQHFLPGLYRLTYFSETAPAIIELSANGRMIGRSAPTQPFATVLSGRTGRPIDLPPTGLCSSDVAPEGTCALEKIHFRVTQEQTVSITVEGCKQSPGGFRILVDPLQEKPQAHTLGVDVILTAYLAFAGESQTDNPQSEFAVQLSKGQRLGVLIGSPDFTAALEVRDSAGNLVASSTDFNGLLDPCREVRIDRLPKFDPLSQADSYLTFQSTEGGTYTIRVNAQYRGETGLYILRTFDVTDPRLSVGQMRTGYLAGPETQEFLVNLPPGWKSEGSEIIAYSPLPVSIKLTDEAGQSLAPSLEGKPGDFQSGIQPVQLSMLHWSSINLDKLDVARLGKAKIQVKAKEAVPEQFFLIGLDARWGSCGGGAVDPISVLYPAVSDFRDQGYPITGPKMSAAQLEATLYSAARRSLRWYFLLESPDREDKDPETLVSSYVRYIPEHVPLSAWLVEFQLAIRVQFSAKSGATRLWTRVERRGYKEKGWQLDTAESANAQQMFARQVEEAFRELAR